MWSTCNIFPVFCEYVVWYEENEKSYITVSPVILRFYMGHQVFITIRPIIKKETWENDHDVRSWWHYVCRKIALLKCISFATSYDTRSYSFWATKILLVLKEVNYYFRKLKHFMKMIFFSKTCSNSKTKMKFQKNYLYFCRTSHSSLIDLIIDSVGWTVHPVAYLPRTQFFHIFYE